MKFRPKWESIEKHTVPEWYDDAKLGIFIHWGIYSVPAWATPLGELGKVAPDIWFENNPYSEWYMNTLRIEDSPTHKYHREKYGDHFQYADFVDQWKAEKWNPNQWAETFKKTGAKYVVMVTKHHDGFNLWPSHYTDFHAGRSGPGRDLVGELTKAVRNHDMKMGLYYSGILDWQYTKNPIETFKDLVDVTPQNYAYADYAYNQVMELIDQYEPDILWNDIGWPDKGLEDLKHLFAYYYNKIPTGIINDRWSVPWNDFTTHEYESLNELVSYKWEATRGLGFSFGVNNLEGPEHTMTIQELVHFLIDIVSKNGNLLLNIGPNADGTLPAIQLERLQQLGDWMEINGEAIYGTRPWTRPDGQTSEEIAIRYTYKNGYVFASLLGTPSGSKVTLLSLVAEEGSAIELLGLDQSLTWTTDGNHLVIDIPTPLPESVAHVFKIKPAAKQVHEILEVNKEKPKRLSIEEMISKWEGQ